MAWAQLLMHSDVSLLEKDKVAKKKSRKVQDREKAHNQIQN